MKAVSMNHFPIPSVHRASPVAAGEALQLHKGGPCLGKYQAEERVRGALLGVRAARVPTEVME